MCVYNMIDISHIQIVTLDFRNQVREDAMRMWEWEWEWETNL